MKNVQMTAEEFLKGIGSAIRKIRLRKGIKQSYLAGKIGITQSALSKYESGKTDMSVIKLKEISDNYDVPITDFFIVEECPSMMFKKIVSKSNTMISVDGDDGFDRYILMPEHEDKRNVLKAVDTLATYGLIDEDAKSQIIEFIVEPDKTDSETQKKRLLEYYRKIEEITTKNTAYFG